MQDARSEDLAEELLHETVPRDFRAGDGCDSDRSGELPVSTGQCALWFSEAMIQGDVLPAEPPVLPVRQHCQGHLARLGESLGEFAGFCRQDGRVCDFQECAGRRIPPGSFETLTKEAVATTVRFEDSLKATSGHRQS